jgi:hypothetical protein
MFPPFPIIQYGDDTLIIMEANVTQLQHLTEVLRTFGATTGLRVNYAKSNLIPINIQESIVHVFTNAPQCQLGALPFTYLGLPLSTTKPGRNAFCL